MCVRKLRGASAREGMMKLREAQVSLSSRRSERSYGCAWRAGRRMTRRKTCGTPGASARDNISSSASASSSSSAAASSSSSSPTAASEDESLQHVQHNTNSSNTMEEDEEERELLPLSVVAPRLSAALGEGGPRQRAARSQAKPPPFVTYEELRGTINERMLVLGGLGALYSFFVFDLEAATSFALGVAGSLAYWSELCEYVASLQPDPDLDMREAMMRRWRKPSLAVARAEAFKKLPVTVAKGVKDGIWHRRMLIPVALVAGASLINAADDMVHLNVHVSLPSVFGGFFVFRVALLYQAWLDLLGNLYKEGISDFVPDPMDASISRLETNPFAAIKQGVAQSLQNIGQKK